jgi:3-oxoacyl-ACP reductase-like protein
MSGSRYSDNKYDALKRQWFALSTDAGGDAAAGHTFGTTDATKLTHVTRWYPPGPIKVSKFGGMVTTSTGLKNGSADVVTCRLVGRGGSASAMGSINMLGLGSEATVSDQFDIASDITITAAVVKKGEYVSINSGTPSTDDGTAANTATLAGEVAFFIDYSRQFGAEETEWDGS